MPDKAKEYIFEVSWEVCNKIGGIYTVLSTKARNLQALNKDHIIFIGPDVWSPEHPAADFTESKTLLRAWLRKAVLPAGVEVRVGRWEVPGRPIAILVKFDALYATKDADYARMWERFGVDSLHAYGDYDEGCAFGRAAAAVIESFAAWAGPDADITALFNEWTTGMGLLTVKDRLPAVKTLFTTHATCIGRSICGNGKPLYDQLPNYNGDQMAAELNMASKHSLEKAAAREADCFTTVSDVTARECAQLLDRPVDIVTPNGFEPGFVPPTAAKRAKARAKARARLLEVARALTGRDLPEDTFLTATSGRCEYRNKGLDAFCDAMAVLDDLGTARPVVAFVMVPAWCAGPREDLSAALKAGSVTGLADPVLTHNLHNYSDDPVNAHIHRLGFASHRLGGRVSVIYVPCYLTGADGIFDMPYYDLLAGFDATVFPSYYEPWGYTPLESVAFGVPTLTTSLSGFGQWIMSTTENTLDDCGAVAIERTDSNYDSVVEQIAANLSSLTAATPSQAAHYAEAARDTAARADWSRFIDFYIKAFKIASVNNKNIKK